MKETIKKYTINLNQRLISYNYNILDKSTMEQKRQYLIPLNASNIELIVDYTKQENGKNGVPLAKDPIIKAIERGLTTDRLTSATFEIYRDCFPIAQEKNEELIKPKKVKKCK